MSLKWKWANKRPAFSLSVCSSVDPLLRTRSLSSGMWAELARKRHEEREVGGRNTHLKKKRKSPIFKEIFFKSHAWHNCIIICFSHSPSATVFYTFRCSSVLYICLCLGLLWIIFTYLFSTSKKGYTCVSFIKAPPATWSTKIDVWFTGRREEQIKEMSKASLVVHRGCGVWRVNSLPFLKLDAPKEL